MYEDKEHKAHKRKIHKRTLLVLVIILLTIINIAGLFVGAVFYNEFCVLNTRIIPERFKELQIQLDRDKKINHWQDISINSRFGYILKGTYLANPRETDKTVIFVHGISASRLMGLWYADIYLGAGYNVLIYDSRAHGESGGSSVTWGYYEKYDLDQWIDWVEKQHPNGAVGVHGVSMGAATALLHSELNETTKRVKFYVADSSYADLEELLLQQIEDKVSSRDPLVIYSLLKYSSAIAYLKSRFFYGEVVPIQAVANVTTPILYMHGEADPLVPVEMCSELYAATKGYREIHTFPGEGHAMAIFDRKAEYYGLVREFLRTTQKSK